jgi:hypothetical protein
MLHLKLPEKQEQAKPKTSRRREIIKIRAKIESKKKNIQRITKTKSWFFEKINNVDKSWANLTKMRMEKTQSNKIKNEKGRLQQTPRKSRGSSGSILRTYIQINGKIRRNRQIARHI